MMTSYFHIGGHALEPPHGFYKPVREFANRFPAKVDEYENLLTSNPIWGMRTKGVARITAGDAVALGASGPTLRGSGIDFDLRRDMPYSGYENFRFKVPVSQDGDVFARYICRVREMRESIAIVQQALDGMPEGRIKADAPKVVLPDREKMKTEMEASSITSRLLPRVLRCRRARFTKQSSHREVKWVITWSATGPLSHIASTCGLPAWPICNCCPRCARAAF